MLCTLLPQQNLSNFNPKPFHQNLFNIPTIYHHTNYASITITES